MRHLAKTLACVALVSLLACGDDAVTEPQDPNDPTPVDVPGPPASLTLSSDTLRFAALGAVYPLDATVSDSNGIALGGAAVTWSSADTTVAAVDGSGRVEAVGVGETEVTASAGNASDGATVIVTQSAASVSVSPAVSEIHALADSVRYSATVRDANGSVIPGAIVEWTSADQAVATVDAAGWVVSQANGTAVLTATAGDVSDEAAVVVDQVVASVDVSPAVDTLAVGDAVQLDAAVADSNGAAVATEVVWTTSDPTAVAVDGGGNVTAVGRGADAVITAAADGVSGSADVHVLDQIAFSSERDPGDGTTDRDIYIMNADGSNPTRVTYDPVNDWEPAWSPDGTKLAFRSYRGPDDDGYTDEEIWVMHADGSYQTPITTDTLDNRNAAWSPDGSKIAMTTLPLSGLGDVYVVNADGTEATDLTPGSNGEAPAWSPDGTQIAFWTGRTGGRDIYIMDADGSNPTRVTTDPDWDQDPAWSPDGSKIAFVSLRDGNREIYVIDVDGSNPTRLTNDGAYDLHPVWSPDGTRIAFTSYRDGDAEIYVMHADGTGLTNITSDPASDDIDPAWRPRP